MTLADDEDVEIPATESSKRYLRYMAELTEDIAETVQQFGCQPILFVGSGLSKRYFSAPTWEEILERLATLCSTIDKGFGYYKQALGTPMAIGEEFSKKYQEWAWGAGHNDFPEDMFSADIPAGYYIKYKIAEIIKNLTPGDINALKSLGNSDEIAALQSIKPHAIITTNYDALLEIIFPELQPVIGQQILKGQQFSIGEIFKIHGCVSEYGGIVFTGSDYAEFARKKKFLSAKLLTFFNEHPLLFIGYSATDPNIQSILSDIDEVLPEKGGMIPNVYILQWNPNITEDSNPPRDKVIPTEEGRSVRVKLIEANDFCWVFNAFSANPILNNVSPRVLRALLARSYELVRHDIPKSRVEADFKMLTESVDSSESFAKLFGIATISDYSAAAAHYKYSATQLGIALGFRGWHSANKLIERLRIQTGFDMKASDNIYHRKEQVNRTPFHKYSQEAVAVLMKLKKGQPFDLKID